MFTNKKHPRFASKSTLAANKQRSSRSRLRRLMVESLEDRRLLNVDWRNPVDSFDVDNDGSASPLDALVVINYINAGQPGSLPAVYDPTKPYLNVDGDKSVSPLDVLSVINHLNANGGSTRSLAERAGQFVHETSVTITLGQTSGTRSYRVRIDSQFDTTDGSAALEDLLAVYLVDPKQPTKTLLDRGTNGTALFTLAGTKAEFVPGQVRWDGSILDINLSDLALSDTGLLKFQLLNSDSDGKTKVTIQPLTNQVDVEGTTSPKLTLDGSPVAAGASATLANLTPMANGQLQVGNVRFDASTGKYNAELRLRNDGDAVGRDVAVVFPGLPAGVSLRSPSGTTTAGEPYINLKPAIPRGGLTQGSWSEPVAVEFNNPGQVQFVLKPKVLAATNHAPTLAAIPPLTVMPGGVLNVLLVAADQDGDAIAFSLQSTDGSVSLPTGTVGSSGTLKFRPTPSQLGTYRFDVIASDGALEATRSVTLNVVADPLTTTRVSGKILQVNGQPLAGMPVQIGAVQGLTLADGSFTLDLGAGTVVSDAIKVRGELYSGPKGYPFIAEKLAFILGHAVYARVNNVIDRPIYLPEIDVANGKTVDPTRNTTVTSSAIPGAKVEVAASTLMNQQGTPFTGVLSITDVPVALTPAALPEGLIPDLVVTIQPGEMVFTRPTPLSLPNQGGYAPGTLMDLWSINPVTGEFDKVGVGQVSANGSVIDTISGGIRNSSWHFFDPPAPTGPKDKGDPRNKKPGGCPAKKDATSSCELHSGALIETHDLVTYQSQGIARGLTLTYDSLRADPRPIVHFTFDDLNPNQYSVPSAVRLIAELDVSRNGITTEVAGFAGGDHGLTGNKNIWRLPLEAGTVDAALQVDLRNQPTGMYDYTLRSGMLGYAGARGFIGTLNETTGQVASVNTRRSSLGAGWGISGLLEIVENSDGSVLIINGNGNEHLYPKNANGQYDQPPGEFAILSKLPNGTFRRVSPDKTIEQYGSNKKLASLTDRNGNVSRYEYDSNGRFIKFTDSVGLETTLTYSQAQVEIIDPAGRTTRLNLDANGNLIRVTDPDGSSRQWRYDSQHRMTGETDQLANVERSNYGFHGRVTDVVRKDGSTRQYSPIDIQGLFPPEQTAADPIRTPLANPIAGRIPLPESTFVDINGNATTSKLDNRGQVVSARDNNGSLLSVIRDVNNQPVQVTDANGHSTRYTYDDQGNVLTKSVDLGVSQTSFGSAMQFDGIDDHVQVEDSPALRPVDVTLEMQVNFASVSNVAVLISKTVGGSFFNSYIIFYHDGQLNGYTSNGSQFNLISMPWKPEVGRWYQVAYTYDDAANTQTLYINGAPVATGTATVSIAYDAHPLLIGREIDDERLQYPFPGSIDEVRIWNVARKPEAIRRDMLRTLAGDEAGLIAYYQFNESSTDEVLDSTANQLHGMIPANGPIIVSSSVPVVQSVPSPSGLVSWWSADGYANDIVASNNGTLRNGAGFTPGIVGLAFAFDGHGSNDVVRIPDAPDGSLDGTGDLTINAWINPTVIGGDKRTIVAKLPASGRNDVYGVFLESGGRLGYVTRVNGGEYREVYSDTTIPLNAWTHIAVTTKDETVRFYINGNPNGVRAFPYTRPATNGPLTIGSTVVDTSHIHTFHGGIDEVQLFNRALTPEDIRSIFRAEQAGQSKPILYDATSDFSLQSNPNGVWAYGYSTPQIPAFTRSSLTFDDGKVLAWRETTNGPYIVRPRNRVTQGYGSIVPPPDVMNLDPSFDGRNSVVQWTAPVAGSYRVNGRFEAVDHSTTKVTVILNDDASSPFISVNIDGLGSQFPFDFVRTFAAGDRLQFTVNSRGNVFSDGTGLSATIILEGSASTGGSGGSSTKTATTTYAYEPAFNQLASVNDEVGRKTHFSIDPTNGNTIAVTNVVGAVGGTDDVTSRYAYAASGQIDTVTDSLGRVTKMTYDALGRPTKIQRAFGTPSETSQQFQYVITGRLTATIDENSNRTQYAYDAMNRLLRTTFADGSISRLTYDARGNVLTRIDPLGQVESQELDRLDRPIQQTDADGNVTRYQYDRAGNLASVTDPLNQVTRTLYDARRRPITSVDEAGNSTRYKYDVKDQLTTVQDARGNKTSYVYDTRGNVTQSIDPLGKITSYKYDDAQQLVEKTDRLGRKTKFAFNDLGELTTETWLNPITTTANVIQYTYNPLGLLVQGNDSFSSMVTTRDVLNRIQQQQTAGPNGIPTSLLNFTYDAIGNVLTQNDIINSVTGATNTYAFDNRHRTTQVIRSGPGIATKRVNFAYNALGQATSLSRFADSGGQLPVLASTFSYDTLNRLTSIAHRNAGNSILDSFSYQYDAASRITQIADIDGVTNYAYNTRDELIAATHADPNNPDETYAYDATGNRTTSHLHGRGYVVGNGVVGAPDVNRLTSDGKFNYTYDANGNLVKRVEIVSGKVRELGFDHRNRLVQITDRPTAGGAAAQVVKYTYDFQNRRIASNVDTTPADANDGKVTYFVYAGEDVIADVTDPDGSGPAPAAISMRYLHGPSVDQVLAQESASGEVQWMLTDHLGTVRNLVNNSGQVVNHLKYDSYGNVISESNPAVKTRYKYTGREFDTETGMQYNRARYYDAAIGRFISEDPIGFAGGDANIYRYVANSPLSANDPFGLSSSNDDLGSLAKKIQNFRLQHGRDPQGDELDRGKQDGYDKKPPNPGPGKNAARPGGPTAPMPRDEYNAKLPKKPSTCKLPGLLGMGLGIGPEAIAAARDVSELGLEEGIEKFWKDQVNAPSIEKTLLFGNDYSPGEFY